ncbi:MAG: M23 family metallopeptidase [Betaproteobacteria bacterium]
MQLIWLSGPTGKMWSFSITRRRVMLAVAVVALIMISAGVALHFVGLRLAVAYSPQIAQQLGGVTSASEQARIEQAYRDELDRLRERMGQLAQRVGELETAKAQFHEALGISKVQGAREAASWFGRGGPLLNLAGLSLQAPGLGRELAHTARQTQWLDQSWGQLHQQWTLEAQRLARLPVGLPLRGEFFVSSGFGLRNDPITGAPTHHEGLDFVAPTGTPVLASAPGTVTRSEWAGPYGQLVEIAHAENYKSRYAHLSRRSVQEGQRVERGQLLGHLGSTGRSTGPHLHYEVEHRGLTVDPVKALAPLSWR